MENEFLVSLVNKLHGYHTRCKELHYSAPSYSIHEIINDFDGELCEFEDAVVENTSPLFGFIRPGELNPVLPEAKEFEDLLEGIRGELVGVKKEFGENLMASGLINIVDDFFATVNKYIYLAQIAKHKAAQGE